MKPCLNRFGCRFFSITGLAVSGSLLFFGCRQDHVPVPTAKAGASPVTGDAFVSASLGDASHLNPLLAADSASGEICSMVFNGLVKYDKDLKLVGDLAVGWDVKDHGKTVVFHLRKNVRWHDGKPFTAGDVLFTYQRLVDPNVRTPFGADYALIRAVTAPDRYTVKVVYKEPFAPALESWGIGIVPEHVFKRGDFNTHPANRRPIGTGPYKFLEWKTDEKIVLKANADYFEGRPFLNRYIFRVIPDSAVQFLELRNESVDSMSLTPDQYKAYPEFFRDYNKYRYPAFSYTYLAFNLRHPFFKDRRVRLALACALDKHEIIDGVLLGLGRPATGPFPPGSWAFDPDVRDYSHDPQKAAELLKSAGWLDTNGDGVLDRGGQPFEFTLITNQGNKMRELTAVILQSHLARLGIKMNVRVLEWSAFINDYVNKLKFDAVLLGWNLSRDPDQYAIWHSSQRSEGRYNFVGYTSPEADKLLEEGRRTFDFKKRRALYRRLHRRLAEDLPYVFLYYPESLPTVHKRFAGPEVAPAGLGWNFREWYVPKPLQKYNYAP